MSTSSNENETISVDDNGTKRKAEVLNNKTNKPSKTLSDHLNSPQFLTNAKNELIMNFGDNPTPQQLLQLSQKIKTFTEGTDQESSEITAIKKSIKYFSSSLHDFVLFYVLFFVL